MATLTQLKDARNAGLNLAKATQDFAQVDILSVNKDAPAVVAAVKVAADAAIAAATAVGGAAAPLPATQAIVSNAGTVPVQNSAGAAVGSGVLTVAANAVSNIKLPTTVAAVTSGLSTVAATGTGTKVTFTVANGVITAITLSE